VKPKPIVCPFCPLHCDDLQVDPAGSVNVACQLACEGFADALHPTEPRIGNSKVSMQDVIEHARERMTLARPVVLASHVPLSTAKLLSQLQSDRVIDWIMPQSTSRAALRRAISRDGMISATLGDVRRHTDCLWILGNGPPQTMPRWRERIESMDAKVRTLHWPAGVSANQLADLLDALRHDQRPASPALGQVYDHFSQARSIAIVWFDDGFKPTETLSEKGSEADSAATMLLELVLHLNDPQLHESRRGVLVTLDEAQTARSVSLWRCNEVAQDRFLSLIGDQHPLSIHLGVPPKTIPLPITIQVGGRDGGPEVSEAYAPTAIAGVHHRDMIIRGDGSVSLPLQSIADSHFPAVTAWLAELFDQHHLPHPQQLPLLLESQS